MKADERSEQKGEKLIGRQLKRSRDELTHEILAFWFPPYFSISSSSFFCFRFKQSQTRRGILVLLLVVYSNSNLN